MMQRLPEERRTNEMFESVMPRWAKHDWESARDWFDDLPEGTARDRAMRHIEMERMRREEATPRDTFELFLEMEKGWQRDSALHGVLRTWARKEKETALEAVRGSSLSDKEKEGFERYLK